MQGGETVLYYSIGVCLIVCLTLVFLALSIDTPGYLRAKQELLCAEFLVPLGYTAVAVTKKNDVWIPLLFDSAFKRLNELLRPAGFDFSKWRGYRAAVYECGIAQENGAAACAVLYLYGEQVIGGYLRDGGGMRPLMGRKTEKGGEKLACIGDRY